MDGAQTKPDVEAYALQRMDKMSVSSAVREQVLQSMSTSHPGLFLWATLLLDQLESADTQEDQLQIVRSTPSSLCDKLKQDWAIHQRKLNKKQVQMCREIFMLIISARRPLTPQELSGFLAFDVKNEALLEERRLIKPSETIEKLCQPFVSVDDEKVQISHSVTRDFIVKELLAGMDSDADMAEKCLGVLGHDPYSSTPFSAALLRRHVLPTGLLTSNADCKCAEVSIPYEYAALNWQGHVTAVEKPSKALLIKLKNFITGIAAVTWSERLIDIRQRNENSSINVQIDVRAALAAWVVTLAPTTRKEVPLDEFFIAAHVKLQAALAEDDEDDRLLPYLPEIRLGQYFSIAGKSDFDFQRAYECKKRVVEGFTKVLGKRNPLTLQARTEFVNEFFSQGLIKEAEVELTEVVGIERDVLGFDSDAYYRAVQLLGNARYYLTRFEDASQSLVESAEGLIRLLGEGDWNYQVNNLYHGWVFERQGDLDYALRLYTRIVDVWIPIRGKTNGLSLFACTSIGSILRKRHEYESARLNLEFSWESRSRLFTLNSNTTVDSGLQLALLYRDMGRSDDALQLLDQVRQSAVFATDFERTCQAAHIKTLVQFDQGHFSQPVTDLKRIIHNTSGSQRQQNNRECLWIRILLADALRHAGQDAEALMSFSELVKPLDDIINSRPSTPTLSDEPEPAAQLKVAEEALRMVRNRDVTGADRLLSSNHLQWARLQDFYIRQGGPPTDTAWIAAINFQKTCTSRMS